MQRNEYLLELYQDVQNKSLDYVSRIWETVKFFTTIFIALTTITISLLTSLFKELGIYVVCLSFLPFLAYITTRIGLDNFMRECARLFEQIAIKMKGRPLITILKVYNNCDFAHKLFFQQEFYLNIISFLRSI